MKKQLEDKKKDVENLKTELESLPYKEGEMEALQKV